MGFAKMSTQVVSSMDSFRGNFSDSGDEPAPRPSKRRRLSQDFDEDSDISSDDSATSQNPAQERDIYSAPSRIYKRSSGVSNEILSPEDLADLPSILHPRNTKNKSTTNASFASLQPPLSPWLISTLRSLSITHPTPIQGRTIPAILNGNDILASAPTGTGKTLAFALPILHAWACDPFGIYALILTPTRELALQIYEQFSALGSTQDLKCVLITGGSEMRPQATALARRPHVVVATPGRLADHIRQSGEDTVCGLRRCRVLVLDEADRLLDKNARMLEDLGTCLETLPLRGERQTLLYTATMTDEVRALQGIKREGKGRDVVMFDLSREGEGDSVSRLNDGSKVKSLTHKSLIPSTLKQTYLLAPSPQKAAYLHVLLLHLLAKPQTHSDDSGTQIIIFTNRTSTAQTLALALSILSHSVVALHSLLPQSQRTKNLSDFRARKAKVLVSTDVGSRGLDIEGVGIVINYDVPRDPSDYVHRIGRTARAGKKGTSITFAGARDVELIQAIEARVSEGSGKSNFKMAEWTADGDEVVNLETRVVKEGAKMLKEVGAARMEATRVLESSRDENGRVRRIRKKR